MSNIKMLVAGAAGKMGRMIVSEALATPGVAIAGGFERAGHPAIGKDLGLLTGPEALGAIVEENAEKSIRRADALIDFTMPAASVQNARIAAGAGVPIIIGTTGFSEREEAEIAAIAAKVAIVKSGNMSIGVNLLAVLVREAAARLGPEYDIEIVEAHHRAKIDAPSGTALMLARAAALGRGVDLKSNSVRTRDGAVGERPVGAIGFAVVRGGGIVGDHETIFAGAGEIISLSHRAIDRGLFARGAIAAAKWAIGRSPGLYSMADVLGFSR